MMRSMTAFIAAVLLSAMPTNASQAIATQSASPKDVGSINGIITAVYASISGPKGQARDWNRFRSLFIPDARLIAVVRRKGKAPVVRSITIDRYIELDSALMQSKGFTESETGRQTTTFHGIASVMSSYSGRFEGSPPFDVGVNNFQLFYDGTRWYVVSVYWDTMDTQHPIPSYPRPQQ